MGLRITPPTNAGPQRTQKLTLCMIMKDEEEHLVRCLESVQGVVDEIVIVDTGSTDASIEIAERYGAKIIHEPWLNDFAHHRNTGLAEATGDWVIVMDADEELVNGSDLLPLLNDDAMDGYSLREVNYVGAEAGVDSIVNAAFRVFRNRPEHRYTGALHEQIAAHVDQTGTRTKFVGIELLHYGYLDGTTESKRKMDRNMRIALQEVRRKPDDAFILFNAGVEFQRQGKHEMALDYFRRAFKNLPDLRMNFASLLMRNIVATLLAEDRYDDAIEILADAVQAYPGYTDLLYLEGQAYANRRQYRAAIGSFRKAIEIGDHMGDQFIAQAGMGSFICWNALGTAHEYMGDVQQAVACYRRSITSSPGYFAPPFVNIIRIALDAEDPDTAVALLRSLLPTTRRVDALHDAGNALLSGGYPGHALPLLEEALALEPTLHSVRVTRGHCLVAMGRFDEAEKVLNDVPETSESYAMAAARLALAGIASGNGALADEGIGRARAFTSPAWGAAWDIARRTREGETVTELPEGVNAELLATSLLDLARALLQMSSFDAFNDLVPVLLRHAPDRVHMDEALGMLFYEGGFGDQALECLVGALQGGADIATGSATALARICAAKGFDDDAETFFRVAIEKDRENQARIVDLAAFLGGRGRYAEAEQAVKDGLKTWPHSTVLGELSESLGLMAQAGR